MAQTLAETPPLSSRAAVRYTGSMRPIRSFMFVPGHRESWIDKIPAGDADAVILDLEDSVPPREKCAARELSAGKIGALAEAGQRVYVRVNKSAHLYSYDDLMAVVRPGLEGIYLAMPNGPEDVALAAAMIAEAEDRNGVPPGSVRIVPGLETARGLQFAYECAVHPRVDLLAAPFAKGADLARSLGLEWTAAGTESLYLKSRVVMAARAAGKLPVGGLWQQVNDLDGLAQFLAGEKRIGMTGSVILHPSNATIANRVFAPGADEIAHARAMIEAYETAAAGGVGSVLFGGEHIDLAHVETARAMLAAHDASSG